MPTLDHRQCRLPLTLNGQDVASLYLQTLDRAGQGGYTKYRTDALQQAFNFSYLGFSAAITAVLVAATLVLSWLVVRLTGWDEIE